MLNKNNNFEETNMRTILYKSKEKVLTKNNYRL